MMKTRAAGWTIVVAVGLSCGAPVMAVNWYSNTWDYRQQIVIDTNMIGSSGGLTNFPMLVTEANVDTGLWAHAQAGGTDILFTAENALTRLSHEIELYDAGSSQLCVWVRIPELSATTGTVLYMYYGNENAADQQDGTNVWARFVGVWHLSETNGTTAYDSSASGYHGTVSGGVTQDVQGAIDGADHFEKDQNGRVGCGQVDALDYETNSFSWAFWAKHEETNGLDTHPCGKGYMDKHPAHRGFAVQYMGAGPWVRAHLGDEGTIQKYYMNVPWAFTSDWHHVAVTVNREGSRVKGYMNGVEEMSVGISAAITNVASTTEFRIGNDSTGRDWQGKVDEVRILNGALSHGWITAEYNNQSAPGSFYSVGVETSKPKPGIMFLLK